MEKNTCQFDGKAAEICTHLSQHHLASPKSNKSATWKAIGDCCRVIDELTQGAVDGGDDDRVRGWSYRFGAILTRLASGKSASDPNWLQRICQNLSVETVRQQLSDTAAGRELLELIPQWQTAWQAEKNNLQETEAQMSESLHCSLNVVQRIGIKTHACPTYDELMRALASLRTVAHFAAREECRADIRQKFYRSIETCLDGALPQLVQRAEHFSSAQIHDLAVALAEIFPNNDKAVTRQIDTKFQARFVNDILKAAHHHRDACLGDFLRALQIESPIRRAECLLNSLKRAAQASSRAQSVREVLRPLDLPNAGVRPSDIDGYATFVGRDMKTPCALLLRKHMPELRKLRDALHAGHAEVLAQCQVSATEHAPALSELSSANQQLSTLLDEITTWDPFWRFRSKPLSMPMRTALLSTFGLRVDARSGAVTSTHEFSSHLFNDWDAHIQTLKPPHGDALNDALAGDTPSWALPGNPSQAALSNTRFVIDGKAFDTTAPRTHARSLQQRLSDLTSRDPAWLATVGALLDPRSHAALLRPQPYTNMDAWLGLQPGWRDGNFFLPPDDEDLIEGLSTEKPCRSVSLQSIDSDHILMEFRYDAPRIAQAVQLDEARVYQADPSASAWHARYRLIVGRDGSICQDGPVNIYGAISLLPIPSRPVAQSIPETLIPDSPPPANSAHSTDASQMPEVPSDTRASQSPPSTTWADAALLPVFNTHLHDALAENAHTMQTKLLLALSADSSTDAITAIDEHIDWLLQLPTAQADPLWDETLAYLLNAVLHKDLRSPHIAKCLFQLYRNHPSLGEKIRSHAYGFWQVLANYRQEEVISTAATAGSLASELSRWRFSTTPELLYLAGAYATGLPTDRARREQLHIHQALCHDCTTLEEWHQPPVTAASHTHGMRPDARPTPQDLGQSANMSDSATETDSWRRNQPLFLWSNSRQITDTEVFARLQQLSPPDSEKAPPPSAAHITEKQSYARTHTDLLGRVEISNHVHVELPFKDILFLDGGARIQFVPLHFNEHWSLLLIDAEGKSAVIFDSNLDVTRDGKRHSPSPYRQEYYDHLLKTIRDWGFAGHLLGGRLQQFTPNSCGPMICLVAQTIANIPNYANWHQALSDQVTYWRRTSKEAITAQVSSERLAALAGLFEMQRFRSTG
ncbi:Ulp1 family isopeptidase [Pandoraea iniqua]|nr:Ulp1 family isopeptidase [Pandoraea iniqua]